MTSLDPEPANLYLRRRRGSVLEWSEGKSKRNITHDMSGHGLVTDTPHEVSIVRGDPGILGLAGFALITFCFSVFNVAFPHESPNILLPAAILFGGIVQIICGLLNFGIHGGTFTATVLSSFGAFWAGQGLMMIPNLAVITGLYTTDMLAKANGVYNLAWSLTAYWFMFISLRLQKGTWVLVAALFFVGTTLLLLCVASFGEVVGCQRAAGVTGLIAAVLAWWKATADLLIEEGEIIPTGRWDHTSEKGG
ncbi:GPR1/FUN34/yaaH family-domain-containing protein [Umbelopsis sp. PMI_123]|nr:GPR1/FUN34/yaaH family-domain-containing protein [Umbelopsis sp. PMI_123]